jgi:hypothetical protein
MAAGPVPLVSRPLVSRPLVSRRLASRPLASHPWLAWLLGSWLRRAGQGPTRRREQGRRQGLPQSPLTYKKDRKKRLCQARPQMGSPV